MTVKAFISDSFFIFINGETNEKDNRSRQKKASDNALEALYRSPLGLGVRVSVDIPEGGRRTFLKKCSPPSPAPPHLSENL